MSTNTTTIHGGSAQYVRGALGVLLAVILLAAAALFALNAGPSGAGIAPAPASDSQVLQKALIDARAGERPAPAPASDSEVLQKALIDARAGERAPLRVTFPSAEFWAELRADDRGIR